LGSKRLFGFGIMALMLLSILGIIPIPPVRALTTFNSAIPIEINTGYNSYFPSAMVSADGTIWLAYEADLYSSFTPRNDIFYQYKIPGGTWTTPLNITTIGQNVAPSLAQLANKTIIMFWSAQPANNICSPYCNIYYAKYNGAWSKPVRLTNGNFNDTSISAAVDQSGKLWIVWTRTFTNCSVLPCTVTRQLYYRTLQGNSLGQDTILINDPANLYREPSLLVGRDGVVRVAFTRSSSTAAAQIYTVTYTGTGWTSPIAILPPGSPLPSGDYDSLASMMQDRNGTIWIFSTRNISLSAILNQDVILGAYSYDNGNTFSAPTQLTSDSSLIPIDDHMTAAVQGPDKNIWVFYISDLTGNGNEWDIYALESTRPIAPVYNLALSSIKPNVSSLWPIYLKYVPQSPVVSISVVIKTTYNIGAISTTVNNGTSRTLTFFWNTTGVTPALYSLKANVSSTSPLLYPETVGNLGDNNLTVKNSVRVWPLGDVVPDGTIDVIDAGVFIRWFDYPITAYYLLPWCDYDNNGYIDIIDVGIVETRFGLVT
jgi:hypothetical protein